ncbi:MAG: Coenzyme F420 hydrogenase/dehydrogenase, beta subunit C-terminal domain [Desulfovibrionaceae bacterium]
MSSLKRGLRNAPDKADVLRGTYDRDWLLGPVERVLLGRASDPAERGNAASGGVLSATLCRLLVSGRVDAVLAVGFAPDNPVRACYLVLDSPDAVLAQAGSVYSYIPAQDLKRAAQEASDAGLERLAVVCQPCHVPMVRRWQEQGQHGIQAVFSFFCGWNMTFEATLYLLHKAGIRPGEVADLGYRRGPYPGGFGVRTTDGRERVFGKECYELVNLQFVRPGCSRCTLYMGEGADLACGDAWLRGQRNLTAVLARTLAGLEFLESARAEGRVELFEFDEQRLVSMHLHNLKYKKYGLEPGLRFLAWLFGKALPKPLAPFRLLSALSRWRRKRKIGIDPPEMRRVEEPLV